METCVPLSTVCAGGTTHTTVGAIFGQLIGAGREVEGRGPGLGVHCGGDDDLTAAVHRHAGEAVGELAHRAAHGGGGVLLDDRRPDQIRLDPAAEHVVVQLDRADGLVLRVLDVEFHDCQLSAFSAQRAASPAADS